MLLEPTSIAARRREPEPGGVAGLAVSLPSLEKSEFIVGS
jgi:hypothetical protein